MSASLGTKTIPSTGKWLVVTQIKVSTSGLTLSSDLGTGAVDLPPWLDIGLTLEGSDVGQHSFMLPWGGGCEFHQLFPAIIDAEEGDTLEWLVDGHDLGITPTVDMTANLCRLA